MPPNDLFDYLSGRLRQIHEAFALLPVSVYPAPESELSHTGLHVRKVDSSGRPLASQSDFRAGLCPFSDFTKYAPCQCLHHYFSSKCRCCKWDLNRRIEIGTFSLESRSCADMYFHKQISRLTASCSWHTLSLKPDAFSILYPLRDVYFQCLRRAVSSLDPDFLVTAKSCLLKAY